MLLFSIAFQIGATSQISDEDANAFIQEFLSNTQEITGIEIFLNNLQAALPMFVPGFGIIWGSYTAWSTGMGFASMVSMAPALAEIAPLSILYMSPFGFMELVAYAIAMSRSLHIVLALIKRKYLKDMIKPTTIEFGIVIGILLAAGYLEEYMISAAQGM
ncbi:stage II sporulation protein M [Nitrosopumilus sp. K4]|nr:stage II sporulation protein M [Nitrosopumilus sp. K4]